MRERPIRARRVALARVTSLCRRVIRPVVGRVTPLRMLTSEDLPAPLGPMTPSSSPALTSEGDVVEDLGAADAPARPRARSITWNGVTGGATVAGSRVLPRTGTTVSPSFFSVAVNIGWSTAWSSGRIVSEPLGPSKVQPSSALTIASASSPLASRACTIIWPATKPSLVNRSTLLPCFFSPASSAL